MLPVLGPNTDVVAPDLGTNADVMGLHAADDAGRSDLCLVTGKPEILPVCQADVRHLL